MAIITIKSEKYGIKKMIFDRSDATLIKKYKWSLHTQHGNFYARTTMMVNGVQKWILAHRLLMDGAPENIDHKNRNGLDNRRENLRLCNQSQNIANSKVSKRSKTGFKGVTPINWGTGMRYRAQITHNGKMISLGCFKNVKDAAKAYNDRALNIFGDFANLNNP
jgi:hypothetical protein